MVVHTVGKYRPICHTKYGLLCYRKEKLYLLNEVTDEIRLLSVCPIEDKRRIMCFTDFLSERVAHLTVYCGIEVENGALIAFNRGIYFVNLKTGCIRKEFNFELPDMRRPLNFYKIEKIDGFDDTIICPDYSYNEDRKEVNIYARSNNGEWKVVYTFPAGSIRHIHSIIQDPYRNRVLILTGDLDSESTIWEAKNNFKKIKPIVGKQQRYRACCAKAFKQGVLIVTDSPFDTNYAYIVEEKTVTDINCVAQIKGPTVFFNSYKNNIIFATDVEENEKLRKGIRQYISNQKGPGCADWNVHMYVANEDLVVTEILTLEKDCWPLVPFTFGNIHFPNGQVDGKIYFYPISVKKYSQKLCYIDTKDVMGLTE